MAMGNKEKKQMIMLGALVAVIVGVGLYMNREAFIPESTGPSVVILPVTRYSVPPEGAYDRLFKNPAFMALKAFGDIPVVPGKMGTEDPFGEFQK